MNALKEKDESGEIVLEGGRDDILARAIKKPEHGGRVRGVGSGITNTEYFGFCRPTPPSQMRAELTGLRSEVAPMRNNQQFMMTFIMSCLDHEQMKQFMVGLNKTGMFGGQGGDQFSFFSSHVSDQHVTLSGQKGDMNGSNTDQFGVMNVNDNGHAALLNGQKNGFFTQLLNNGDDDNGLCQRSKGDDEFTQHHKGFPNQSKLSKSQHLDPEKELVQNNTYFVHWPNDKEVGMEHQTDLHIEKTNPSPSTFLSYEIDYGTPISKHVLPQCAKIIQNPNIDVLQSPSSQTSTTKTHDISDKHRAKVNSSLLKDLKKEAIMLRKRRGSILISIPYSVFSHKQDVNLDCEDLFDWCYQREIGSAHMSVFMKHLSESCNKDGVSGMYGFCDSNYLSPLTPTYFPGAPNTYSQENIDELRDIWAKYFFSQIEDEEEEDTEDNDNMDVRKK
ncbi:hypothetical protein RND81_11G006700 [Saponaria officinalis]|uniref:Uncharacterized protein n=1 Tax=Saponaria officinalis TaxID=3572 RepID=A0AAW1HGG6_SAPOF